MLPTEQTWKSEASDVIPRCRAQQPLFGERSEKGHQIAIVHCNISIDILARFPTCFAAMHKPMELPMSVIQCGRGIIRKLWPGEEGKLRDHLLRLDPESRRMRFSGAVSDDFIRSYADTAYRINSLVFGYLEEGELRGASELRPISGNWPVQAEAAFSVEKEWQDSGIGSALMDRILLSARNRAIKTLYMICLSENERMQKIAKKHDAHLHFEYGSVEADLDPAWPSPMSLLEESMDDGAGFVTAVLERAG